MTSPKNVADQANNAIRICPKCSKEMESGYLLTPTTAFRSVRWSTEWSVDPFQLKGDKLVPTDWWGSIKISGFRCKECRVLVLTY